MNERELYPKVMGIEEARKEKVPMPPSVKIPKSARLSTSGGHCYNCGQDTLEGHEDDCSFNPKNMQYKPEGYFKGQRGDFKSEP